MLQVTAYQGLRPWVRTASAMFSMGLLIALVSMGLAACGYRDASISSTLSPAQVAQARTQVQPQVKKCGIVVGLRRLEVPADDTGARPAENCFWQAFQHCEPATLVLVMNSFDTPLIRTFTIHNDQGECSLTDARQLDVEPGAPSSAQVFTCAGLTKLPGGLLFSACGQDGDIVVPGV